MIKKILAVIVILVAAVLILASTKPENFRVERSINVKAPPAKVFALIDDFHNWPQWSPWEKMDPNLQRAYSGPALGTGAAYAWEGNSKVGAGRMEIIDTASASKVTVKLDFLKPMKGSNTAEFTLQPVGDSTKVTWAMYGPNHFLAKVFQVFFSMDKMIGKDFNAGLSNLKTLAEK